MDHSLIIVIVLAPSGARKRRLQSVCNVEATLIFYVPPTDLLPVLRHCGEVLGPARKCCVARELTKVHEVQNVIIPLERKSRVWEIGICAVYRIASELTQCWHQRRSVGECGKNVSERRTKPCIGRLDSVRGALLPERHHFLKGESAGWLALCPSDAQARKDYVTPVMATSLETIFAHGLEMALPCVGR